MTMINSGVMNFNNLIKNTIVTELEFSNLVKQNKISMYRIAMGILNNEHDAEDAINESIYKAYKNMKKLRDKDAFKGWIIKILINECYLLLKKRKKIELTDNMEKYNLCYEENNEYLVMDYINRLNEKLRIVLILFYYEDLSIKEISKCLKIPEGTVKSRLSRGKAELKVVLEEREDFNG